MIETAHIEAELRHTEDVLSELTTDALMEGLEALRDTRDQRMQLSVRRDMLTQQLKWWNRHTGWTWPRGPAWTD